MARRGTGSAAWQGSRSGSCGHYAATWRPVIQNGKVLKTASCERLAALSPPG